MVKEFVSSKKQLGFVLACGIFGALAGCALSAGGDIVISPPSVTTDVVIDGASLGFGVGQDNDKKKAGGESATTNGALPLKSNNK